MNPTIILIAAILASGYYVGDEVVKGIKKVDTAIVHAVKSLNPFHHHHHHHKTK